MDTHSFPVSVMSLKAEEGFTLDFQGTRGQNLASCFPIQGAPV